MNIQESLDKLKAGNKMYVSGQTEGVITDPTKRLAAIKEQKPYAVILSCSDSRVVPEFIFDTGIGELFVIRIAGNVSSKTSIASMEYAVNQFAVKLIIVLGHQDCMAVTSAIKGEDNGVNLNYLLAHISPAVEASNKGESINNIVRTNAKQTVAAILNKSEILKNALDSKAIKIVPAYYHLKSGKVDFI